MYTPSPHHEHEERERIEESRRERDERRERFAAATEPYLPTRKPIPELDRLQIDKSLIIWHLGVMSAWESEKGKEVKAALRSILAEVEKQISQEKFNGK